MTTYRSRKNVETLAVPALLILLLTIGLGVSPVSANQRASRTRSKSAVSSQSGGSSSGSHSSAHRGGSAQRTRQVGGRRASSRSRSGHHGRHHRSSLGLHFGFGRFGHYYPYYGYSPFSYYGYHWGPYYLPPYRGYGRSYYGYGDRYLGALDLNVKPKKSQVFVDGEYVGLVKSFDGYPGYLWLEKGTYELSFYLPGYQTLTRTFAVYPGGVVGVRERLEVGEAVLPEKPEKPRERTARRPPPRWRDREYNRDREHDRDYDRDQRRRYRERPGRTEDEGERDMRGEPGRVRLMIAPKDATVYLDGRLLGSGEELGRLRAGLIVDPGSHQLEIVRPGFESRQLEFQVEEGEELDLSVQLTRGPAST